MFQVKYGDNKLVVGCIGLEFRGWFGLKVYIQVLLRFVKMILKNNYIYLDVGGYRWQSQYRGRKVNYRRNIESIGILKFVL